ncbi:hypothetical protein [Kushneria phosphatilytica]|uniref:Uncharacterized protein n=1 Tax=Kushneria phosphatilytica TaxID=657387 RepID=A0A5C0ZUQ6_9GAMM|nr:hypothetical protein [Kushneria phosphatilytica]QEL09698.1 hypothetical protein FY550_00190 [Kushneria phosphatilytica]
MFGIGHASRGRSAPGPLIDALCRAPLPAEALRIQAREQEVRFRLAPSPHATRRTEISVWLNVENCQVFVVRFDRPVDDPCAPPTQQTMSLKKIRAQLEQHIRIQCRHHGWQQVDGR